MRLALDHHYSPTIALRLRELGFDVVAVQERGWHSVGDEFLLNQCADDERSLLTNNVADFLPIVQRWAQQGRLHAGLIFTSDRSMPRTRAMTGAYVDALSAVLLLYRAPSSAAGLILWLSPQ